MTASPGYSAEQLDVAEVTLLGSSTLAGRERLYDDFRSRVIGVPPMYIDSTITKASLFSRSFKQSNLAFCTQFPP